MEWPKQQPRNLSALEWYRVILAAICFGNLVQRLQHVALHLALPPAAYLPAPDIFLLVPTVFFFKMVLIFSVLAALSLAGGWAIRLSIFILWLTFTSLMSHSPYINEGGDVFLRVLLFWSLFLELGRPDGKVPGIVHRFALRCLVIQTGILYLGGFLSKFYKPYWRTGRGLTFALNLDFFRRQVGSVLLEFPRLLRLGTYFALMVEALAAIAFLLPFPALKSSRRLLIFLLVFLHLGIFALLDVGIFPYVSICVLFAIYAADKPENQIRRSDLKSGSKASRFILGTLGVVLLSIIVINVSTIFLHRCRTGEWGTPFFQAVSKLTGTNQDWFMFSGIEYNPRIYIIGALASGEERLFFSPPQLSPRSWDPKLPDKKSENFNSLQDHFWRTFILGATHFKIQTEVEGLLRAVCSASPEKVESLRLISHVELRTFPLKSSRLLESYEHNYRCNR